MPENKFGLVYENAVTENVEGKVTIHPVSYEVGAFEKAVNAKSKELFLIEGAAHIRTYWVPEYVDKAVEKLKEFFGSNLKWE